MHTFAAHALGMEMPSSGEWLLALMYVAGVLCVGFYFFIKDAEQYTGAVRVLAIVCRMISVIVLATGLMAVGGFFMHLFASDAWNKIQLSLYGIEAHANVLSVRRHQVMRGRRFRRRSVEAYAVTLKPAPQCGTELVEMELDEMPKVGDRVYLYCLPNMGIVARDIRIGWGAYFVTFFFVAIFCLGAWLLVSTILYGWRPLLVKGSRR
jgi:hypothetical protein